MRRYIISFALHWSDRLSVDPDKKADLDQRSMNARQEYDLAQEEINRLKSVRQDLESCSGALASREHQIKTQRERLTREKTEVARLKKNLGAPPFRSVFLSANPSVRGPGGEAQEQTQSATD